MFGFIIIYALTSVLGAYSIKLVFILLPLETVFAYLIITLSLDLPTNLIVAGWTHDKLFTVAIYGVCRKITKGVLEKVRTDIETLWCLFMLYIFTY